jgi:hypothetical protein
MTFAQRNALTALALATVLVLVAAPLTGCGRSSKSPETTSPDTARAYVEAAQSELTTTAPDARLLVVQTAQAVAATATPSWVYLFGSPSTGRTYAVYFVDGKSMGAQEYGSAGLTDDEWSQVPDLDAWKVDSDVAYSKALSASGAKGDPAAYIMGLVTYMPAAETSTVEPFVWNVQFDPGTSGATTSTVEVNATTGATTIAK